MSVRIGEVRIIGFYSNAWICVCYHYTNKSSDLVYTVNTEHCQVHWHMLPWTVHFEICKGEGVPCKAK